MESEWDKRLKSQKEARRRAKERKERLANRPLVSQFTITADDEREAQEFQRYLVAANLTKAERGRRLTSSELRLALTAWGLEELRQLWAMREQKLTYLEDCALLLTHIRYRSGIDSKLKDPSDVMGFDVVQSLAGVLEPRPVSVKRPLAELERFQATSGLEVSGKRVELVLRAIREGQAEFRRRLIDYYGPVCMATGTRAASVIDAAHIIPYGGVSTNLLSNGLLLRKDIHALFDAGSLTIGPDLVMYIAPAIEDKCYRLLDGTGLFFTAAPRISTELLRRRMREGVAGQIGG